MMVGITLDLVKVIPCSHVMRMVSLWLISGRLGVDVQ